MMKPQGTVYTAHLTEPEGETELELKGIERKVYKYGRRGGALMASFAITMLLYFYGPAVLRPLLPQLHREHTEKIAYASDLEEPAIPATPTATPAPTPTPRPAAQPGFRVKIPAINAESDIIPNIDPFDENAYGMALKSGVAHADTSALPGEGKTVYLFAHSTNSPLNFTQFNAVFYQLRQLRNGNSIIIEYGGERYTYKVMEKRIVEAEDTHYLYESDADRVILQTCDPPGTTFKRLLVFAEPA